MWWGMLFTGTAEARVHVVARGDQAQVLDLTRRDTCYVVPLDDPALDLRSFVVRTASGAVILDDLLLAIDPAFGIKRTYRRSTPTFFTIQVDPEKIAHQDGDEVDLRSSWAEIRHVLRDN